MKKNKITLIAILTLIICATLLINLNIFFAKDIPSVQKKVERKLGKFCEIFSECRGVYYVINCGIGIDDFHTTYYVDSHANVLAKPFDDTSQLWANDCPQNIAKNVYRKFDARNFQPN